MQKKKSIFVKRIGYYTEALERKCSFFFNFYVEILAKCDLTWGAARLTSERQAIVYDYTQFCVTLYYKRYIIHQSDLMDRY
jgi:hypothetical protein